MKSDKIIHFVFTLFIHNPPAHIKLFSFSLEYYFPTVWVDYSHLDESLEFSRQRVNDKLWSPGPKFPEVFRINKKQFRYGSHCRQSEHGRSQELSTQTSLDRYTPYEGQGLTNQNRWGVVWGI